MLAGIGKIRIWESGVYATIYNSLYHKISVHHLKPKTEINYPFSRNGIEDP